MKKNLKRLSCFILILVLSIGTLCVSGVSIYAMDDTHCTYYTHPSFYVLGRMEDDLDDAMANIMDQVLTFGETCGVRTVAQAKIDACDMLISTAMQFDFKSREERFILPLLKNLGREDIADLLKEFIENLPRVQEGFIDDLFSEEAINFILKNYRDFVNSEELRVVALFGMLRGKPYDDTHAWLQDQGL